jgi:predicted metalloendopeptidase
MSGVSREDLPCTCIVDIRFINAARSVEGRRYTAFDVQPREELYLAPAERVRIW